MSCALLCLGLHILPWKQDLSLNLEQGWWPVSILLPASGRGNSHMGMATPDLMRLWVRLNSGPHTQHS